MSMDASQRASFKVTRNGMEYTTMTDLGWSGATMMRKTSGSGNHTRLSFCLSHCNTDGYGDIVEIRTQKEITSQTDLHLVILSSKTYVFEEEMTKY